ncbi:eukaryotic translation initiation factor 3 subunit B [Xylona heveae TC161]|uniref:Eukaryotic translation initiation factor 3 subunit B n=1 Tax=Xylona heveae (strain CBS 132557 / TC161) TaxID=1328760 RepID=A0A165K022_XYLHT|nr:eukaryotic translation initiation factor 3 subunit B [Xylona heveae TC161]KZF26837.1 eukaryotic translation initiation factor 3 subunit B [Xylona heveae TC161]
MAPSFQDLPPEEEHYDEDEDIDFSDLREQYEVRLEEGLDAFIVIDGLPVVPEESKSKLIKFLLRKLNTVGKTREDAIFMPLNDQKKSEGFAFVEYETPEQAIAAARALHGVPLDKKHTMLVNKLTDIDRYGREGRVDEEYKPPVIEPFVEKEHLRWWLGDPHARDQFAIYRGDNVGVYLNRKKEAPENIVDRQHWTESFVQWSPQGTYLISVHAQGVQLWAGPNWTRQKRFAHPFVNLVDFSPNENYLVTWSHRPIHVDEGHPVLSMEEDGKNYIIWDVATGKALRSFQTIDLPGPAVDEAGNPVKKKIQWPAFKWSADDKYVARMTQGQSISIYELPRMNLLDKTSIKIDGVMDFEWAPATPQRDGIKNYEQLFCYWTPEIGSNPAKVGLMSIPSKEIVRTRNLFNVSDAKLHWQSQSKYVCVKVDRHSKSKKSLATNLEIFRVKEKGVPVEVVDSIKDTVINFAWEPKGDRFVLITTAEVLANTAVPPKTSVSFFCPEKVKGQAIGNFKHIRTIEKKNSNAIYWSPKGRFVVVATVHSQQSFELDFWDLDYEGEKPESEKDLTANLQLMATADHYGVTDVEWDPTGRYVVTSASIWKHAVENGYHIYDFKGTQLREEHVERLKQIVWRPRPPTLLTKEEQKQIRKNLREYSKIFEEEDQYELDSANFAIVEHRRRILDEWLAWRASVEEELRADRKEEGLPETPKEDAADADADAGEGAFVEEIVEEIIDETEEIVS